MRIALVIVAALAVVACQSSTTGTPPPTPQPVVATASLAPAPATLPQTPQPTTSPIPPTAAPTATVAPALTPTLATSPTATIAPASASASADCINGWITPAADSAEYQAALEMIESQMGVSGPWTVADMRYFTGPDVPWIIDPHYDTVQYWYVRASLTDDPKFAGRWLLEQRTDLIRGISAVAPYGTTGYASPNWTGFTGDGKPKIYVGLPGLWPGVAFDFVTGAGDSGQPGLPDQVIGCLSGT
jgi:hypothetical protein